MIKPLPLILCAALVACAKEAVPENTMAESTNATASAQPAKVCAPPSLAVADGDQPFRAAFGDRSAALGETEANFSAAFARACSKGLLKDKSLIDPKAADQDRLFLINAPEANVASIYLAGNAANRMTLEFYFLTNDGRTNVPSVGELEEAIYCAAHGATPEEQESSGRCLPD
jgi:hypothetical protein